MKEPEANLGRAEAAAVEFHGDAAADAEAIWVDGLNLLLRGSDGYHGYKINEEFEHVVVALLTKAWNSLYCAHDLALRGYHLQALNLLRLPVEDWAAYWYLRCYPDRWKVFRDPSEKQPTFNELIQAVEAKHGMGPDTTVRAWIKRLHAFSHVDAIGVLAVTDSRKGTLNLRLGTANDERAFRFCTGEAIATIVALADAMDNFLRLIGRPGLADLPAYAERVAAWQKAGVRPRKAKGTLSRRP